MQEFAEILAAVDFGHVDSESELDLDEKYLRTADFARFVGPSRTDLVLGAKGAGKTALFQLFDRHEVTVRRWAGAELADVVIQTANGMRDLSNLAGGELSRVLLREDLDFERLWSAYIGWQAAAAVAKADLHATGRLKHFQRTNGLRRDWRLMSTLRRGWNSVISDSMPGSLKVTLFGTGVEVGAGRERPWEMGEILKLADHAAGQAGKRIWLLFDNLDELLSTHRRKRIEALNALFTVCNQLRASYPNLQPRIFLRTDIWSDVEFNNKSHWVGKELRLSWSDEQLLRLMLKRVASNETVRAYLAQTLPALSDQSAVDDISVADMRVALFVLFETPIEPGGQDSWRWMLEHSADGHGQALPRELITFGNLARERQQEGRYATTDAIIAGEAVKKAYPDVSRLRCETFLAEFPELRSHFNRFNAKTTPRFHRSELDRLMKGLSPSGNAMIDALCDVGVIEPVDGHRDSALHFDVPLLYRPGLKLKLQPRR
jgi:hypothetical protein